MVSMSYGLEAELHTRQWDAVIIGGGIAGLTAAIYLARANRSVLLLEKSESPGGRADSTRLADAWVNLGAHALNKSVLPILREVGVKISGSAPGLPDTFLFQEPDGSLQGVSLSRLLLGSFLTWSEKRQLIRFLVSLRRVVPARLHEQSLEDYLVSMLPASTRVRSIVLALVRLGTYCDAPDKLSAGAVMEQLKLSQVLYIDGGWKTIVRQLTKHAEQAGVTIVTKAPVQCIAGSYPDFAVTIKGERQISARCVLSTAGPSAMLNWLDPALPAREAEIYKRLLPVHAACMDLVLTAPPSPETKFVLGCNTPWYYSNHSSAAILSEQTEHAVVHVMKYLPIISRTDAKEDQLELERFLDGIQPGWRESVVERRFLPRMLVSHAAVTAENGGLAGRPGTEVPGRPGLYIAGDWVGPEGMLVHASLASARAAAQLMIERLK